MTSAETRAINVSTKGITDMKKDYTLFGTKIFNQKSKTVGLLICTWKNKFADGNVDCLGFLPRSQSFAYSTACLSAQSVRYPSFTRTEIRFATCVNKKGKRYNIELDSITPIEEVEK